MKYFLIFFLLFQISFSEIVPTNKYFFIKSVQSGPLKHGFWDQAGRPKTYRRGTNLSLWELDKVFDKDQLFKFVHLGGDFYNIVSKNRGYVDVSGGIDRDGGNIHIWRKNKSYAQTFRVKHLGNGRYKIYTYWGKLVSIKYGIQNGSNIQTWEDSNESSSEWWLINPLTKRKFIAEPETAYEIMQELNSLNKAKNIIKEMTIISKNSKGEENILGLKLYQKTYTHYVKSLNLLSFPEKQSLLINDYNSTEDNIVLKKKNKSKRIKGKEVFNSFFNTDFSYSDLTSINLSAWNFKILKNNEVFSKKDCWLLEAKSKFPKNSEYTRQLFWIRKDIFAIIKAIKWKEHKLKYYTASHFKYVQDTWTPTIIKMSTVIGKKQEHSTVILVNDTNYPNNIKDEVFSN